MALQDVTVRFGGIAALRDVSLQVEAGEVMGIIGPNGAGKSTLFDVISGVRNPDGGTVWINGTNVSNRNATSRAKMGVRRTYQRQQVFGWLSVEDNVLVATEWRRGGGGVLADMVGLPSRRKREQERRERVQETLEACGLSQVKDVMAGELPIGLARMVEFARAVVDEPSLLLLDEPTSGLDDADRSKLGNEIEQIRDSSCAVVLVEHDVEFVMQHCDRIAVLVLGEILAVGSPDSIQENEFVRSAYLGEG